MISRRCAFMEVLANIIRKLPVYATLKIETYEMEGWAIKHVVALVCQV